MRACICCSGSNTSRFGLLNSDVNWAEEVANLLLLIMKMKTFAYVMRGATYYASSSFRSNDYHAQLQSRLPRTASRARPDGFCRSRFWSGSGDRTLPGHANSGQTWKRSASSTCQPDIGRREYSGG